MAELTFMPRQLLYSRLLEFKKLSEKIAEEFASQGGLGIAERIGAQLARPRT